MSSWFTGINGSTGNKQKNEDVRQARRTLIKAAKEGNTQLLLRSLSQGASVDSRDKHGDSVLNLASFQGHEGVVELLISKGATIDKRGKDGMTALAWAAQQDHAAIVELLLHHGANLTARCSDGSSVLHQAAYAGSIHAITTLVNQGEHKCRHSLIPPPTPLSSLTHLIPPYLNHIPPYSTRV